MDRYIVRNPFASSTTGGMANGEVNLDKALLRVDLPDASPTCMEWMTGSKLAVGYHDGESAFRSSSDCTRMKADKQAM